MNLSKLSTEQLIETYSEIVLILKERKVIRTKKLVVDCSIIFESNQFKSYTFEDVRKKNPNAYFPWSKEDDEKLEFLFCEGKTKKELASVFKRNAGAINARIKKLELNEKYNR